MNNVSLFTVLQVMCRRKGTDFCHRTYYLLVFQFLGLSIGLLTWRLEMFLPGVLWLESRV